MQTKRIFIKSLNCYNLAGPVDLFFKSFFLLPLSLEFIFYLELVWEPGAAQVTNSYSRCLPALLEIMVLAIFSFKS